MHRSEQIISSYAPTLVRKAVARCKKHGARFDVDAINAMHQLITRTTTSDEIVAKFNGQGETGQTRTKRLNVCGVRSKGSIRNTKKNARKNVETLIDQLCSQRTPTPGLAKSRHPNSPRTITVHQFAQSLWWFCPLWPIC